MKVYLHKLYTEAHRRYRRGVQFADALEAQGIEVALHLDTTCDVAVCGAFCMADEFQAAVHRQQEYLHEIGRPLMPVVQLCFDLYPIHVEGTRTGMNDTDKQLWQNYVQYLSEATAVIAPSASAARRIRGYVGHRRIHVVKTACDPWWREAAKDNGCLADNGCQSRHVLDVLRPLDDWGCGKTKQVCDELGIPCLESRCALSFAEFRAAVLNAGLLVSAYQEASTGGLTLPEGYALGKPVLINDSPMNGANEYFAGRAHTFRSGDLGDLKREIKRLWDNPPAPVADAASWVEKNYSDQAMARELATILHQVHASRRRR